MLVSALGVAAKEEERLLGTRESADTGPSRAQCRRRTVCDVPRCMGAQAWRALRVGVGVAGGWADTHMHERAWHYADLCMAQHQEPGTVTLGKELAYVGIRILAWAQGRSRT